jgi:hypothetical protein
MKKMYLLGKLAKKGQNKKRIFVKQENKLYNNKTPIKNNFELFNLTVRPELKIFLP